MKGQGNEIQAELIHYQEHAHDPIMKAQILNASDLGLRAIAELNVSLGEMFAKACLLSLGRASISPAEVDIVGSHGQTLYHHSGVTGARRATLQVADGDMIAVKTGCYVISDFRVAISPLAEKVRHFHRSPISCCSLRERRESRADGRYSISGESPI